MMKMKKIRYIDMYKLIQENIMLKTAMEQMAQGLDDYYVKGTDAIKKINVKVFNERNIISFNVNTPIEEANDIINFLKNFAKETPKERKRILAVLEAMGIMFSFEKVKTQAINVLEEEIPKEVKEQKITNDSDESYYYAYNDEEIYEHLMEVTAFFETEREMLEFIYSDEELLSQEGKELLKRTLIIAKKELGNYTNVGQYLLDEHEKVIITKYGLIYSDIMI